MLDRRTFLSRAAGATLGAAAGQLGLGRRAFGDESELPMPCPPSAWRKHGTVLEVTEPWEHGFIQNFTSPVEVLDDGRWRLWYSAVGGRSSYTIAYAEGRSGEPMKKFPAQLTPGEPGDGPFAVGHLPDGWRPTQVVHVPLLNGKHRIYFWAHGRGILRYLAADSDDGRRYRVVDPHRPVLYHPNDRAAHGVPSPDGVMLVRQVSPDRPADEPQAPARLISNDATNIYQLSDGTFEMYSVALISVPKEDPAYMPHDNAPGLLRVIDRYTSEDGLRFGTRNRVIQRDANDFVDQQFYHLAVTYTPRGRVGMLGHYRVQAQTMDLEWCFSTDGLKWHRPVRSAWLPRGDSTQPDSYGIYPPSHLVHRDGRYHLFYSAVNSAHNGKHSHGPSRSLVMYATADSIWA
ncbi:MAG: hypothetical protein GXY55_09280 [Phycisphaerae bacterium]|nr:hypothetical protein [Phycisphaerae bacterium]